MKMCPVLLSLPQRRGFQQLLQGSARQDSCRVQWTLSWPKNLGLTLRLVCCGHRLLRGYGLGSVFFVPARTLLNEPSFGPACRIASGWEVGSLRDPAHFLGNRPSGLMNPALRPDAIAAVCALPYDQVNIWPSFSHLCPLGLIYFKEYRTKEMICQYTYTHHLT